MADISKIKIPGGNTYNIDAVTVNGHSVNADVPASADFSAYVKRLETIAIGDTFTPFPGQMDENGVLTYCEYLRKRSDGRAEKIFRVGDINAGKYSDLQAYYNGTDSVIWQLRKIGVNVGLMIDGKYVAVRDEIPSLAYATGSMSITSGLNTVNVGFKPSIAFVAGVGPGVVFRAPTYTSTGFVFDNTESLTAVGSGAYIAFR